MEAKSSIGSIQHPELTCEVALLGLSLNRRD
ncbi:MAG: hypothetical protein K0R20_2468 [Actinomycetia bacterium]|jgi:hypothetical protein|nr:hypothetical protein [Actinomycetes bacterium]